MTRPFRASTMAGTNPLTKVNTESKLIAMTRRHSWSVVFNVFDIFSLITPWAIINISGVSSFAAIFSVIARVALMSSRSTG